MTAKRGDGEGTVFQNKRGQWVASLRYTDPVTGKRGRRTVYAKTKTGVLSKLRELKARLEVGAPVRDSTMTIADWLGEWREGPLAASSRSDSTKGGYTMLSKKHLDPAPFGAIAIGKLRPSDVDRLLLTLRDRGLSESTVRQIFITLRVAIDDAVRDGLVAQNVVTKTKCPRVPRKEARFLSPAEVTRLLEAARDSRYHSMLCFIAQTGVRKSEALNTKWADVDLDARTYRVPGTKTASSRRVLPLSPSLVSLLKRRRREQFEERLRAGDRWVDTGLVFTTQVGTSPGARDTLRALKSAAKAAGLKDVCVHTLRHSAATTWLENGVNLKAVSVLLGHASISTTADVYGHVSDETARQAMDVLSEALGL